MTPVIIIGGILSRIVHAHRSGGGGLLYALLLGFLYKDLTLRDLPGIFWASIRQTISLLFIIAAAGFFGWLTIHQRIPDQIIQNLTNMSATPFGVMTMIMVIVLILGLFSGRKRHLHYHHPDIPARSRSNSGSTWSISVW